ncbi:MAG: ubiquinol-cytochrome c reductase iron-sulfur subunit [Gammaproteobacteria bacterium]|jgi:ubiquinol-cytochrome c reductase iron-sulfur subunit|nr:MAG: ubiquinol-cytochrome c reductase iron-sulfur subunit [Gammaproteobacteria bacterium]
MNDGGIDTTRRRLLTTAATIVGGVGAAAASVPFIASMTPSAKTKAIGAPVEVDLSDLQPGQRKIIQWQGKPVFILRRTAESLEQLANPGPQVRDPQSEENQQPEYARNIYRSIKPEYLIMLGLCTHLGCSPTFVAEEDEHDLGPEWKGGFFCPCHGSLFDLAGRVHKNFPAPSNIIIPPHKYLTDTRVLVGDDSEATS